MADYRLPSLGADMDEAVLVEWKVEPGSKVRKGQVVALIETSKSVMDIEFFEDAVIGEILVPVGETVAVGTPIATYEPAGNGRAGTAPTPTATTDAGPPELEPVAAQAAAPEASEHEALPAVSAGRRRVHPPARRLAAQLGVEIDEVAGTGPAGMVLRSDVRAAAGRAPVAEAPVELEAPGVEPVEQAGPPARVEPAAPAASAAPTAAATPAASAAPREPFVGALRASPRARRLAEEHGIDLASLNGTGPDGAISGEDVERIMAARQSEREVPSAPAPAIPAPPPPAQAGADPDRAAARRLAMRRAIADLMARSKREIPHYYLETQIDMTRCLDWLEAQNAARPMAKRLLPAVLLIKAVARAAVEVPEMNGFWVDDRFSPSDTVHAGIAISLREGGLVAPAIHDAQRKDLDELMAALRDLVTRTRAGVLHRAEMTDPTITITNLGDQGVEVVHGVIYPPQVALVGFGRVTERPWASGGMVGARRALTATLAADHRATDGHRGGIFLAAIDRWLQEPEKL
jgi:pyruvate dehydrogenase E2 component (dihydrolipoamide acetyltransferase)